MHIPLAIRPEFRIYSAFHEFHSPEVMHPGHGLGPFYERGSGVPLNGLHYRYRDVGCGFLDSLKSIAKKGLAVAKNHILPTLKTGLQYAGKNIIKHAVQNLPGLIDSARTGGAKGLFHHAASLVPDVVTDTISDTIGNNPEEIEGEGMQIDKGAYRHFIKMAMMNLLPLLIEESHPIRHKLELMEKLAAALKQNNSKVIKELVVDLRDACQEHPVFCHEEIEPIYRVLESLVDASLYLAQDTYEHDETDSADINDLKKNHDLRKSGGFLPFLNLLGPLVGGIANAVAPALSSIPGPAGQILGTIAKGIGGVAQAFGGSGLKFHTVHKPWHEKAARNLSLLITINVAAKPKHMRHPGINIMFPGLAAHGHSISNTDIDSHHLKRQQQLNILKKNAEFAIESVGGHKRPRNDNAGMEGKGRKKKSKITGKGIYIKH